MAKALVAKMEKALKTLGLQIIKQDEEVFGVLLDLESEPFMFITLSEDVPKGKIGISVDLSFTDVNMVMAATALLAQVSPIEPYEPMYWPTGSEEPLYGDRAYARWTQDMASLLDFKSAELGEGENGH